MRFDPLYKKDVRGRINIWKCEAEGPFVVVRSGLLGGSLRESRNEMRSTNVGRKNEKTPEENAILKCKSLRKQRLDKGFFETTVEAENEIVILPMLASSFDKNADKVEYPVDVQPKLDGVRCLAYRQGVKIILLSRGGKEYKLPHIAVEVNKFLKDGQIFDGEIYIHGESLQNINSYVKKYDKKNTERLEYWIYDITSMKPSLEHWSDRKENLLKLYDEMKSSRFLKPVDIRKAECKEDVRSLEGDYVSEGYEGAIVRNHCGLYNLGQRSHYLLKVKSFQDDEYEIIGYDQGSGQHHGCVIWICKTKEGKEFNVVPKGTLVDKRALYNIADSFIGRYLKVKYFQLTDDGIPQFPVGLGIRLEEDI
jgi:DNA ligase-1